MLPAVGRIPAGLQDERYRTHRAVRALLEALAQVQPIVVVLDDLHWADDASLELVAHLLRRPPRGRVGARAAFRPAPVRPLLATALATAERDGTVIERALGALSFADAETLLGNDIPGPVRGEIYEAGGGNPFFLQQLARQHAAGPLRRRRARRGGRAAGGARARWSRRSRRSARRRGCSRRAPRWRAIPSTSTSRPRPRGWTRRRGGLAGGGDRGATAPARAATSASRSTPSTSCSPAGCWSRPTCRAATASGTRSCATRSTRPPPTAGGSPPTSARPTRWPSAAARSPRGRTTSSAARGPATTRRSRS